ncbi:unnamed protein product, partial [Rotaria sp. Silwood1]
MPPPVFPSVPSFASFEQQLQPSPISFPSPPPPPISGFQPAQFP